MTSDPWDVLLGEAATPTKMADDPWSRWDVAWEDVSRPITEAVSRAPRLAPEKNAVNDAPCAICGQQLLDGTWELSAAGGRLMIAHAGALWKECYCPQ